MSMLSAYLFLPLFCAALVIFIVLIIKINNKNMENKHDAKYVFYYLLSLVALVFTAFAAGMAAFGIINKLIPDSLNSYSITAYDSQLKFAISALLVAAPLFFYSSYLIRRGLAAKELEVDSAIRRWLTYFVIFVSSVIILGTLIGVLNSFLSGELTSRFIFKALTVAVISGLNFAFYFYDIKRYSPEKKDPVVKIFFGAAIFLVLAAFVSSCFFVESPKAARNRRLDQNLLNNFSSLENAINSYYDNNGRLPENIAELKGAKNVYLTEKMLNVPESNQAIEYRRDADKEFSLCADFRSDTRSEKNNDDYIGSFHNQPHAAGYQCLSGQLYASMKAEAVSPLVD
jgi:hypothetical protein